MAARLLCIAAVLLAAAPAAAYPGGTPTFQTDAAPFCASCHASRSADVLSGAPPGRPEKELPEGKHFPLIEAGDGGYEALTPAQRAELIAHVKRLDAASTVSVEAPERVKAGETFKVSVTLTGGAGPVVGAALVDAAHRWLARPAPSAGWAVVGAPRIVGPDGKEQGEWLAKRPAALGANLAFVNVTGIASDAAKGEWSRARVEWTLRAPAGPGSLPLTAAYWYGTEKASPHGFTEDPVRGRQVRGGFTGASGRLLFAPLRSIRVE
jgi:hypothetical protein